MKKHIKGMVAYGVLIIAVLVYVLMRVGITFNLTKVMPEFATQIYSKANMLYYDINTIKSAKNQINKQIDKIRNDVYQDKDYFEKGLREILDLNEKNLSEYLASFSEIKKDKYNNLKKVDNIDYITSKGNNYQDNTRQNSLSLYIYPMTAIDNDLYYEMDADFYKPLTVKKDDISKLKVGDKYNFNYPIGTSSEVIELTYEADKKLKYDYEANNGNIDGPNFLYLANYLLVSEKRNIEYGDMMRFGDFMASVLKEVSTSSDAKKNIDDNRDIARIFSSIYVNFVVYDNKGYI